MHQRSEIRSPALMSATRAKRVAQQVMSENTSNTHLTKEMFEQALRLIAELKYPKAESTEYAWRHLIEANLAPVAARRAGKFDEFLQLLTTPNVVQVLNQWESSLRHTFRVNCGVCSRISLLYLITNHSPGVDLTVN